MKAGQSHLFPCVKQQMRDAFPYQLQNIFLSNSQGKLMKQKVCVCVCVCVWVCVCVREEERGRERESVCRDGRVFMFVRLSVCVWRKRERACEYVCVHPDSHNIN